MNIISRKEAIEQGLKNYFTGKPCKRGHIAARGLGGNCRECAVSFGKQYRANNPDKEKARCAKYKLKNKDKIKISSAQYRLKNKDKINERVAKWSKANPGKVKIIQYRYYQLHPEKIRAKGIKYNKANPERLFIRNSLNRILSNWKGGRAKYESLLGYSYSDLKIHIERQFVDGMTWENRSDWHIDHIVPISHYTKQGITDPAIINRLSNLQPLWAKDNRSKGAKVKLLC